MATCAAAAALCPDGGATEGAALGGGAADGVGAEEALGTSG